MLTVGFGEPETKNNFNIYETNSIKIYASKSLLLKGDTIRIKLNSFLGILKSIDAVGFKLL